MARAHAANACVQSDSIKGLAQSIAKPAYHRLLTAEPALRRAVPTLIIAFLITICLGAFVQVIDQNRQKRAATKRDLAALTDMLAERLDRLDLGPAGSRRQYRAAARACCPISFRPGASPPAVTSSSPASTIACSPAFPIEPASASSDRILDVISTAQLLAAPGQQGVVSDMILPNGNGALAICAAGQVAARPGHRHPGKDRSALGIGRGAVGDAVGHHRALSC